MPSCECAFPTDTLGIWTESDRVSDRGSGATDPWPPENPAQPGPLASGSPRSTYPQTPLRKEPFAMSVERRQIFYTGRVQGVGFRATVQHLSRGFQVVGFVKNLPDGRVEVLAEGEPSELDAFQNAIAREFSSNIRDVSIEKAPSRADSPRGFSIHY